MERAQQILEGVTGGTFSSGNVVETFVNGNQIFPAMVETIRSAEHTVDLLTYVYWTGEIAQTMAHELADRAREGVRVRVVLDAFGSMSMSDDLIEAMADAGCLVERFRSAGDRPSRMHHRTHRKLLVVDGHTAMCGGVGIASEWEGDARNPDEWRDTHFRIRGPVVRQMSAAFVEHWVECGHPSTNPDDCHPDLSTQGECDILVLRGSSGPFWHDIGLAFDALLRGAERQVRLTTAYFAPGERMLDLLCETSQRGVGVHLLLPGTHMDQRVVTLASADEYEMLMEAGVHISHYEKTMLHVKCLTVDGHLSMIGSANIDERSMRHNEELSLLVDDPELCALLDRHWDEDMSHAEAIDLERWRDRPLWRKALEALVSPFEDKL